MLSRIVPSHLKTLTASYFTSTPPHRMISATANRLAIFASSSNLLRNLRFESECRFFPYQHTKTLALVAASSPRRFFVCNPVGLRHLTANRSAISSSPSVFPRHFSSESDTSVNENVEDDAMPIAAGNEGEELELNPNSSSFTWFPSLWHYH
ncbi:uncharacterized protein LOC112082899 isoform X2 [Eutrema salsugineum]|uniref:uncharacterized protein LOC112082899 isoform X2 n=1 Tax=Eutrema salsugineum TaxID=72664 RepID=UPI000CECF551|nr:uncharacterized protein LOC112082899 isoform X2 [Eutrema salsugineum]